MLKICYLIPLLSCAITWQLIDTQFDEATFSDNGGFFKYGTISDPILILSCNSASLSVVIMDVNQRGISKKYQSLPPHYRITVISDLIRGRTWDNEWTYIYIDGVIQYQSQTFYSNLPIYGSQCFAGRMDQRTIIVNILHSSPELLLSYYTTLDQEYGDEFLAVRNIQLFIAPCHETCSTCSGPNSNDCLTCYSGPPTNEGLCTLCIQWPNVYLQIGVGCLDKCPLFQWPDKSNICRTLKSNYVFAALSILQANPITDQGLVDLKVNFKRNGYIDQQNLILNCLTGFFGPIYEEYLVEKFISLPEKSKMIRVRFQVALVGEWKNGSLRIILNGLTLGRLYFVNGVVQTDYVKLMYQGQQGVCNSLKAIEYHLEIQYSYSSDSLIFGVQALNMELSDEYWGLRKLEVDAVICSPVCEACLVQDKCALCASGYVIHKGICLLECPPYSIATSGSCIDFDEETPKSKYNFKSFFDLSEVDTLANGYFDLISQSGVNFQKGASVYFSYLNKKRVFGGSLVWLNAIFERTFQISQPHYAVKLFMKVALLDSFVGTFRYQINNNPVVILSRASVGIEMNIWGNIASDYQIPVIEQIQNGDETLKLTIECLGGAVEIQSAACAVYDIFLLVHEVNIQAIQCPSYCLSCTDYSTCTLWDLNIHEHFNSITLTCDAGYYLSEDKSVCQKCEIEHCDFCDFSGCQLCLNGFQLFQGYQNQNGECRCLQSYFVQGDECKRKNFYIIQACHKLCNECFGPTQFQCFSCNEKFNRHLINSTCECVKYYQESPNQNACEEICGDMIKVGNEECDDGNHYRFDGCHKCKFECQNECELCDSGQCLQCILDWTLVKASNKCVRQIKKSEVLPNAVCGNGIIEDFEQCDDSNQDPFDGCFSCQYSCSDGCEICLLGQCLQCLPGWTINLQSICTPLCGDGIISGLEICDFGKDFHSEGCLSCTYHCPEQCVSCKFGRCLECYAGFYLRSNFCQPICDSRLAITSEQCQNHVSCSIIAIKSKPIISLDQCGLGCEIECATCWDKQCLSCKQGYELRHQRCFPICGDNLVVFQQECDDGRDNYYNVRCEKCRLICHQMCSDCFYGNCLSCESDLALINGNCIAQAQNEYGLLSILNSESAVIHNLCKDFNQSHSFNRNELHCDETLSVEFTSSSVLSQCIQICSNNFAAYVKYYLKWCNVFCEGETTHLTKMMDSLGITNEKPSYWNINQSQCTASELIQNQALRSLSQELCLSALCVDECLTCLQGNCIGCLPQWELDEFNRCLPICGDLVIVSVEECEDGNENQFDGCFECKYQCEDVCIYCERGFCLECIYGWFPSNGRCIPTCGDGILVGDEECDDGGAGLDLSCFNCKFVCHLPCLTCAQGLCQSCEFGLQLQHFGESASCTTSCGDGIVVQGPEQCDDSNINNLDGCSQNCEIEQGWGCLTLNHKSICQLSSFPLLQLKVIDDGKVNKQAQIYFSSLLKQTCPISFQYYLRFYTDDKAPHAISLIPQVEPNYHNFEAISYNLTITYLENSFASQLIVVLNEPNCLVDQQNSKVQNQEAKVYLKQTNIINKKELISTSVLTQLNWTIFYCYIGLFIFSLFLGNLNMMWNLLDLLQFFSYMKYINVVFPQNLQVFFAIFSVVSLKPLTDILSIDEIFSFFNQGQLPYLKPERRFQEYQINAFFLKNISGNLLLLIIAFAFHYIQKLVLQNLLYLKKLRMTSLSKNSSILLLEVRKAVSQSVEQFYYKDLVRILMANAYDLNFYLFLQLKCREQLKDFFAALSFFSALSTITIQMFLFVQFLFIHLNLFITSQKGQVVNGKIFNQYGSLFEGIKWQNQAATKYNSVLLFNKLAFMFILIFLQNQPLIQIILITLIDALHLGFIQICKPFQLPSDYTKNYIHKIIVITICIIFALFESNMQTAEKFLTFRSYQILGWCVIGFISANLAIQFVIDSISSIKELISRFRKYSIKKQHCYSDYKQTSHQIF